MYHNDWMLSKFIEERQRDLAQQLERDRLIRESQRAIHPQRHLVYHMLAWVGRQLVYWGERLQAQHALHHLQSLNHTLGG